MRRLSELSSTALVAKNALRHGPKLTRRRRFRGLVVVVVDFLPQLGLLGQSSDDMLSIFLGRRPNLLVHLKIASN